MYPKYVISSNPDNLQKEMDMWRSIAIEAEYGDREVKGNLLTLSHHGPRSDNPVPCLRKNFFYDPEVVGFSHIDADSIGAAMAVAGIKPDDDYFWRGVAFVDVNGPHKIKGSDYDTPEFLDKMNAYWAFSEKNKVFPERDGSVKDITDEVLKHFEAITKICNNVPEMIEEGKKWAKEKSELNEKSLVDVADNGSVLLRESNSFVNHLYNTHDDKIVAKAVVAYNTERKSITLSFADKEFVSAVDILQSLYGKEAGGHDVIAGTPRNKQYSIEDAQKVFGVVADMFEPDFSTEDGKDISEKDKYPSMGM